MHCLEVTTTDCEMDIFKLADGLQLDDDLFLDKKVQAMLPNLMVAIKEWYRMLANELDSAQRKFDCESFFIDRFEKSWSEFFMNFDGGGDDLVRDF